MLDWRQAPNYSYTNTLNAAQWAWEFLRRNAEYQSDYRQFMQTWLALEADYGAPPERDFQAWKADPRAYLKVAGDCAADDCSVDQDKVLIECALGAKWGFYQFPRDPALSALEFESPPAWREIQQEARLISAADLDYLGGDPHRVALGFDLDMPLKEQLERARLYLGRAYAGARRDKSFRPRSVAQYRAQWCLYLRILDAEAVGAHADDYIAVLPGGLSHTEIVAEAHRLCGGDYREIPLLPEGA
ncbi:MAG: hypothetical protein KKA36_06690 [Gammaproteobacteria bacterium]|nr:hypothetical protein [Gammaproteobacteria bacterium]